MWPESLDALAAAPKHHTLLMEDENVRVLRTRVPAGETVPLHAHRWPCILIILGWSDCVRRGEDGKVTYDSRSTGNGPENYATSWYPALPPHTLENVGTTEINTINIEFKGGSRGCQ